MNQESISFIIEVKVSAKENEVPTEKNSSRASIFAIEGSYTVYQIKGKD